MGGSNEGFVTNRARCDASGDLSASPPALVSPADGATFHNGLLGRLEWSEVSDVRVEASVSVSTRADFRATSSGIGAIRAATPSSAERRQHRPVPVHMLARATADRAGNLTTGRRRARSQ
jgi:hypothetical protein